MGTQLSINNINMNIPLRLSLIFWPYCLIVKIHMDTVRIYPPTAPRMVESIMLLSTRSLSTPLTTRIIVRSVGINAKSYIHGETMKSILSRLEYSLFVMNLLKRGAE